MIYNVYCDETCHLKKDDSNAMLLGAIWCPQEKIKEINERIRQIKKRNNVSSLMEMKWTKVSPSKINLYKDLVNYFFDNDDLHFRGIIIPDKKILDHKKFQQTHELWYYKIYFEMLKVIFYPKDIYDIYIDIKDTHSGRRAKELQKVCCNSMYDFSQKIIRRLQPIRSDEVQIMQIVDIIIGAICYENREFPNEFKKSNAKQEIINLIKERSGYTLKKTTLLREEKVNLLIWSANCI